MFSDTKYNTVRKMKGCVLSLTSGNYLWLLMLLVMMSVIKDELPPHHIDDTILCNVSRE